jgi:hypothetical protein
MAGGGFKVHRDGRMSARQEVTVELLLSALKKISGLFFLGIFWPVLSPPYFVLDEVQCFNFPFSPFDRTR